MSSILGGIFKFLFNYIYEIAVIVSSFVMLLHVDGWLLYTQLILIILASCGSIGKKIKKQ